MKEERRSLAKQYFSHLEICQISFTSVFMSSFHGPLCKSPVRTVMSWMNKYFSEKTIAACCCFFYLFKDQIKQSGWIQRDGTPSFFYCLGNLKLKFKVVSLPVQSFPA